MKQLLTLIATMLLFVACKKTNLIKDEEPPLQWTAIIGPSPHSKMLNVFKETEFELKEAITKNDITKQKSLTIKLANNIASYIYKTEHRDISKDFINDPNGIVSLGLLLERREYYLLYAPKPTTTTGPSLPSPEMDCLFAALGGLVGVNEARTMWTTLMGEGIILDSAIAAARFIGRKVGVALSVTLLLRDVGGCFGWWHF